VREVGSRRLRIKIKHRNQKQLLDFVKYDRRDSCTMRRLRLAGFNKPILSSLSITREIE
jgi:hypothetical protein